MLRVQAKQDTCNFVRVARYAEPDRFRIHPCGFLFKEVRASHFVKVSLDGEVVDKPGIWSGGGREELFSRLRILARKRRSRDSGTTWRERKHRPRFFGTGNDPR